MPAFEQFQELDIRIGTVVSARPHRAARKPAIQLEIDFGELGTRGSSAQLTARYTPDALVGRQVAAVVNFPPRRVAGFTSEVLVLGAMLDGGDVILLQPAQPAPNGTRIG